MKTTLLPLVAIISMAAMSTAQAHNHGNKAAAMESAGTTAYVIDTQGRIVRDSSNRCVRSIDWTKETAIANCEGWAEPKPKPAPVVVAPAPKPKPAPVVVAKPKPAPAPMAPAAFTGHFDFDKADVKEVPALDAFADYMNKVADSKVSITGHTDSQGSEAYNQALSEKRAQDVADYLTAKGISADRIMTSGMGESSPVADNATKAGRAENRRVMVEIVK